MAKKKRTYEEQTADPAAQEMLIRADELGIGTAFSRADDMAPCNIGIPFFPYGTCFRPENRASDNAAKIQLMNELARNLDSEPWAGDFNICSPDKDIDPNRPGIQCDDDAGRTKNDTWGVFLKGDVDLPCEMRLKGALRELGYTMLSEKEKDEAHLKVGVSADCTSW